MLQFRLRLRFQLGLGLDSGFGLGLGLSLGVEIKVSKRYHERTENLVAIKISEKKNIFIPRTASIWTFLIKISLQHALLSLPHEALFESIQTHTHTNT
jgi:hypothetical protein